MRDDLIELSFGSIRRSLFEEKVRHEPSGCHRWTAAMDNTGYGRIRLSQPRKAGLAHRVSYELYKGPIPEGKELDHLCHNRWCVNPEHLDLVTHAENMHRYALLCKRKEACKHGHRLSDKNRYNRGRACKYCMYVRGALRDGHACKSFEDWLLMQGGGDADD
jgi:hypothetical protein